MIGVILVNFLPMDDNHRFFQLIRRAKLDILLFRIAEAVRGMFSRNTPIETVPVTRVDGPLQQEGNVTVTAWNLSDIAYLAICESHDFRSWEPSVHDIVAICNEFIGWDELRSKNELEDLNTDDWILKFSVGFSQKQFWYQELYRIVEDFNRQVELLEKIPKEINSNLDLDLACKDITGFEIQPFRALLLGLFVISNNQSDLTTFTFNGTASDFHPEVTPQNIKRIIDFYTADYREFRESKLEENHFFLKPIVRTSSNRLIAINQYFLARKIAEGPFWAIRDYYLKKDSAAFVNEFGLYFERYVENLLSHYLSPDSFYRIPDDVPGLKADWFIYTPKYRLIIEQKSSIAALMIKRLYPDLKSVKSYLKKFEEGVCQLDETEINFGDNNRITLKILLHFETIYISDGALRPQVVASVGSKIKTSERIFFCDISELEILVGILATDANKADDILDKKLLIEPEPFNVGKEFNQIISTIFKTENKYVRGVINHWVQYFPW